MTMQSTAPCAAPRAPTWRPHAAATARAPLRAALRWLVGAWQTRRQRRQLAALELSRLDDLGLSPREALREARKPIWNVPAHWLH